MAAQRTVLRNTGVVTQAAAQGKTVSFTYVDASGVETKRKGLTVLEAQKTRHNADALVIKATDGLNVRSFRTDRMLRARLSN